MSIIRGRHGKARRARGTTRTDQYASPDALTDVWRRPPLRVPVVKKLRPDRLKPEVRAAVPLTPVQQAVFDALTEEPQRPMEIAAAAGLTNPQVASAVRALSAKGLATREEKGWRRT